MLYDVPGRTATTIALETYVALRDLATVVAVKDATGDFVRGTRLRDLGYAIYSGDDHANLGWLAHGGCGFVSVAGHAVGDALAEMVGAWSAGDTAAALATYRRILPAVDAIMSVPSYGATTAKAALQLLGVIDNRAVRPPLLPLDDDEVAALRAGLEASALISTRASRMSHPHPELTAPAALAKGALRVIPLGGLGEVGRNMTVFEYDGRLLIVDCGVLFPEENHPGVDLILPDFEPIRAGSTTSRRWC